VTGIFKSFKEKLLASPRLQKVSLIDLDCPVYDYRLDRRVPGDVQEILLTYKHQPSSCILARYMTERDHEENQTEG